MHLYIVFLLKNRFLLIYSSISRMSTGANSASVACPLLGRLYTVMKTPLLKTVVTLYVRWILNFNLKSLKSWQKPRKKKKKLMSQRECRRYGSLVMTVIPIRVRESFACRILSVTIIKKEKNVRRSVFEHARVTISLMRW